MRPTGSPGAQSSLGIDQVFLGEEVCLPMTHILQQAVSSVAV